MNCTEYEEQIGLYVEGDLTVPETAELEQHLASCHGCSEFAAELRESQSALKQLSLPAPGPEFRRGVIDELRGRRDRWRWLAAAAALILMMSAGWRVLNDERSSPQVASAPAAVTAKTPVGQAGGPPLLRQAANRPKRAVRKPPPKLKREEVLLARSIEPVVVKMLTGDPDVVIFWLMDGKEKGNEETPGVGDPRGE